MIDALLTRIHIFPIKSLDPMPVEEATVLPTGALQHDRQFALVDHEGKFVNGKRTPLVHSLRSGFEAKERMLHLRADGDEMRFDIDADRTTLESWFSEYCSMPVKLVENVENGFPDDLEAPGPTVISTATLEAVASWFPGLTVDEVRHRFRANLEIEGVPPFWEDRLYGKPGQVVRFRVGEVILGGTNPCQRCVVPSRDSMTGEVWPGFAKMFAKRREENLPPWADRSRFDHFYRLAVNTRLAGRAGAIRVGDVVGVVQ